MEFTITSSAKRKAKRIRMLKEKKWAWIRALLVISFIATFIMLYLTACVYTDHMQGAGLLSLGLFCISVILSTTCFAMLLSFTSQWITSRFNERIWIQDNKLNHFMQISFAGGLNTWNTDESGFVFSMDIDSIHNARFDEDSKRIEFLASGTGYRYADIHTGKIEKQWKLNGFHAVFYDYTAPSLVATLESRGVIFKKETINFKMRNSGI